MTTRDEQSLSSLVIGLSEDIDKLTEDINDLNKTYSQSLRRRTRIFIGITILISLMVGTLFVGFMFNRALANRISDESIARATTVCEDNNSTRVLIVEMLRELVITQEVSMGNLTDEEVEERERRLGLLQEGVLSPIDCQDRAINPINE